MSTKFLDELVQKRGDGGREAARLLKNTVVTNMQETKMDRPTNFQVLIRVYANSKGLAKAYRDANIITTINDIEDFIRGFNIEDPLCDFIDAGTGKECSDEKLRGLLWCSI